MGNSSVKIYKEGERPKLVDSKSAVDVSYADCIYLIKPKKLSLSDNNKARVTLIEELVKTWDVLTMKLICDYPDLEKFVYEYGDYYFQRVYDPMGFVSYRPNSTLIIDELLYGSNEPKYKIDRRVRIFNKRQLYSLMYHVGNIDCIVDIRYNHEKHGYRKDDIDKDDISCMLISMGGACYLLNGPIRPGYPFIHKMSLDKKKWLASKFDERMDDIIIYVYEFNYDHMLNMIRERRNYRAPKNIDALRKSFIGCLPTNPYHTLVCYGSIEEWEEVTSATKEHKRIPVVQGNGEVLIIKDERTVLKPLDTYTLQEKIKKANEESKKIEQGRNT